VTEDPETVKNKRKKQVLLGIDEAGRGPLIGPLVLCGVWIPRSKEKKLVDLGVRDSKSFGSSSRAQHHRAELASQLIKLTSHVTILVVEAEEVDRRVSRGELNLLEQELAQAIIDTGPPADRIVADGRRLFGPLATRYANLEALNKADVSSPTVAAASIFAKVERDTRFNEIVEPFREILGPIKGGGYVNRGTEALVRGYFSRFGHLPPGVRRSWKWKVLDELGARRPTENPQPARKRSPNHERDPRQLLLVGNSDR
jgi:ribonuclease HII